MITKQILESYIKKQVKKHLNESTNFDNLDDAIKSFKIEVIRDIDEKSKQIKVWNIISSNRTIATSATKKGAELILTQLKSNDLNQLNNDYSIKEEKADIYLNSRNQVKFGF